MQEIAIRGLLFALLGAVSGTTSGLFGIGGGLLIVPGLALLFARMGLPDEMVMHLAAGTSLSIMVCTATSSVWAHHRHAHVLWPVFARVLPGVVVGTVGGALIDHWVNGDVIGFLFGLLLVAVSIRMVFDLRSGSRQRALPRAGVQTAFGVAMGLPSGLLGIGGGGLSIPFLTHFGVHPRQVAGTSASFTLPVAVMGTISFALLGWRASTVPFATGYVYWPAFLLVAPFTVLTAPLGAWLTHRLPTRIMRRLFAGMLFVLAFHMLWAYRTAI